MTMTSVLVANRGEIARRVIRGARSLGLRTVAVYVDADVRAPFVTDADVAIRLATGYLDGAAVIEAARRAGADAIHPGYGFLSENADFARAVAASGLTWVGPPPAVIEAMGDKLAAKELARSLQVPVLVSSEDPADAESVGFPLLVKAAAGGGGKGMRLVTSMDQLEESVAAARREALGGFGDDRVFLERYVGASRHVEIQILGDAHGNLVHLGERECSIQRRHQKLVEESPSSIVDPTMRTAMGEAALTLARAIGYQSAGTVEFLVDDATREFFFLEVNTRLQVEHPVTEMVTGVDLVREQLRIADGHPLSAPAVSTPKGWAIEVRLCAEDPVAGFLPATGALAAFEPASEPTVRWESGVERGSAVSVAFDPLLAKVIAHAPTREEAAGVLASALERLHLGGVTTNRDFLAATLRHPGFLAGDTTTDFIERHAPARTLVLAEDELYDAAVAAALWLQGRNRHEAPVLAAVPSGWRNARLPDQRVELRHGDQTITVDYHVRRDGTVALATGSARVVAWTPTSIDLAVNDRRWRARITAAAHHLYVQVPRGTVEFALVSRFRVPGVVDTVGGLLAPMPGVVIDLRASVGEHVRAGATLIVLEAMKMEHPITAPADGVVTAIFVREGEQVDGGAELLDFEPDEPAED
ncbi:MAG: acetyl/propionyl/methylcrotonyl-CoA carboxylase subunit alpha [Acidimicrobiales bacterium]